MKVYLAWSLLLVIPFLAWCVYGYFGVRSVEMLGYEVLEKRDGYEIRLYPEHIIAKTSTSGNLAVAGNNGFMVVADYIFGNNQSQDKVAMTTPVIQSESQKIAMTTPVIQNDSDDYLAFVMPSEYDFETLPQPNNSRVVLEEVPAKKMAVIRFTGFITDEKYEQKKLELTQKLTTDNLTYSRLYSVGYNPPGTPPFMNRLEVWAELE